MLFNTAFVVFVVVTSTLIDIISAADNSQHKNIEGKESGGTYDHYSSSNAFAKSKRSRSGGTTTPAVGKTRPKYSKQTNPLAPRINASMAEYLIGIEKKILAKGKQDATDLCIEAWRIQLQEIPEIEVKYGSSLDCGPSFLLGATEHNYFYKYHRGYIHYYEPKLGKEFSPDLLRCNCATIHGVSVIATKNSKRFFFLLKDSGNLYFVFATHGNPNNRIVKVVNYREIIVPKK